MNEYKDITENLKIKRNELEERLRRIEKSLRKTHDKYSEEQAIERANEKVVEELGLSVRLELEQIYNAFNRIGKKTYGVCVICESPIPIKRLEALP
ncbi:MAG: TraR/DksA family transcriptional regulator, partial [Thermodesulfobacteriota bacterium]